LLLLALDVLVLVFVAVAFKTVCDSLLILFALSGHPANWRASLIFLLEVAEVTEEEEEEEAEAECAVVK
jgi:hypothetical protein